MAILEVPSAYATVNIAYAAASNGDTINIAAGTHILAALSWLKELTVQGATGNPTDVILVNAVDVNWQTIKANNFTYKDLTLDNTAASVQGGYALWLHTGTGQTVDNVHVISSNAGVYVSTTSYLLNRVKYHSVRLITDTSPHWGIYGFVASQGAITNCSSTGHYYGGIKDAGGGGTSMIINCTAYPDADLTRGGSFEAGIRGSNIYNSACQIDRSIGGVGIWVFTSFGGSSNYNTSNYIGGTDFYTYGGFVKQANDYDSADVVASGVGIFADVATLDLHPVATSLIDQNGDTAKTTKTALDGAAWKNPPSRGCYEFVSSGGGSGSGKASLNNLANLNNLNNLS